jgi:hypothetical protein
MQNDQIARLHKRPTPDSGAGVAEGRVKGLFESGIQLDDCKL